MTSLSDSSPIDTLAAGKCYFGVARVPLRLTGKHPMAGYSWIGKIGRPGPDTLCAKALYLRDADTQSTTVFCIVDLVSGTRGILLRVEQQLGPASPLRGRVILCGTHTHSAPGRIYGNGFYDRFGQRLQFGTLDAELAESIAEDVARACREAEKQATLGTVRVLVTSVDHVGTNRSLGAFQAGSRDPEAPRLVTRTVGDAWKQAVDPRLTAIRAEDDAGVRALFGWFGCHGTALGLAASTFDRDWLGAAVDSVAGHDGFVCALGVAAAGDVSPLPSDVFRSRAARRTEMATIVGGHQGPALKRQVGEAVGSVLQRLASRALPEVNTPLFLQLHTGTFRVAPHGSHPRWQIGVPALGGSEDGGPTVWLYDFVREEYSAKSGRHRPKAPALGLIQDAVIAYCDLAETHPWHRVRLGDHLMITVPGEPTILAAATLEQFAKQAGSVQSASILGCTGDYAGYFSTFAEYQIQSYEGASTLYGPQTLEWLRDQIFSSGTHVASKRNDNGDTVHDGVPRRHATSLLAGARQIPNETGGTTILFATARRQAPALPLLITQGNQYKGVIRPFPDPDVDLKDGPAFYTAEFLDGSNEAVPATLTYRSNDTEHELPIQPLADAVARVRYRPASEPIVTGLPLLRLTLGAISIAFGCFAFVTFFFPQTSLVWVAGPEYPVHHFDTLMVAAFNLGFGLLAVNLFWSKNTTDLRALLGHSLAALVYSTTQIGILWAHLDNPAVAGVAAVGTLLLFSIVGTLVPASDKQKTMPFRGPFWVWLSGIALLTGVTGILMLFFPERFLHFLCGSSVNNEHVWWMRFYGIGFLTNTITMWASRHTRDLSVVRGQFWASWVFDTGTLFLLGRALHDGHILPRVLLLLMPFAVFAAVMPVLALKARRLAHAEFVLPRTVQEVARLVRDARRQGLTIRVGGSGHSVPESIFGSTPIPRSSRPSSQTHCNVSLTHLCQVVAVDRALRRITVQAGMHIGESPGIPSSASNNLLLHLKVLGWALGDLGGVVHQTVAGFLATGSAGGSLKYALHENVFAIRYVDGFGVICETQRGEADFPAVLVSLGLLGVVTEVTFECEERYYIRGREYTANVDAGGTLQRPLPDGTVHEVHLTTPDQFSAFFKEVDYCRILWWPQKNISKMVIWEGQRDTIPNESVPYLPDDGAAQWAAGVALGVLGWSYGVGFRRVIGRRLRQWLLRPLSSFFMPKRPIQFHAGWDVNLPMDTLIDDTFLPVDFTELWFPLCHTHQVMQVLMDMYQDEDVAGAFVAELYVAKANNAWLSPAYERDSFRVDLFWFRRNQGDPVLSYFPQFYARLAHLCFRPHWGKYLPEPDSAQGAAYLRGHFDRLDLFLALRAERDPDGVFLTEYWRRHLDL